MATSAELEALKEKIRQMPASAKKGDAIYDALILWMPLQTDEDWVRLIHERTKSLNQREIAAELCGTDNIWKRERFRMLLDEMNTHVNDRGLIKKAFPYTGNPEQKRDRHVPPHPNVGEGDPLKDLVKIRLETKLRQTEGKLHQATIRINKLEKTLEKYTDLAELNRALEKLIKPRK